MSNPEGQEKFFELATQYYAAGRWGLQVHLMPVGANLLHHAVEMYLKAHLCQTMSTTDLKQKIGHSLTRAWDEFKRIVNDSQLTRFDPTIQELNKFENLRYPDTVSKEGATIIWSSTPAKVSIHTADAKAQQYRLSLPHVDELIGAVIARSEINLEVFKKQSSQKVLNVLTQDNAVEIWK